MKTYVELRSPLTLREAMTRKKATVRGLAREVHISPSFVSHLLSPDRQRRVALLTALQIADALDVEPQHLWEPPAGLDFKDAR